MWRHVLRNALLPTIAVVATQTGYLLGGLVIVERAFNYPGLGQEIVNHAVLKDYSVVQAGAMVIGAVYLTATVLADIAYGLLNPAHPLRELRLSATTATPEVVPAPAPATKYAPARRSGALLRSPTFDIAVAIILFWTFCAIFGYRIAPHDPTFQTSDILQSPSGTYPFGTDQLGRDVLSRTIAGARSTMLIASGRDAASRSRSARRSA